MPSGGVSCDVAARGRVGAAHARGMRGYSANGRDAVAPLPAGGGREATRLARSANPTSIQLGQHAVLPLPETYPTRGKGRRGAEAQGVWIIFSGEGLRGVARGLKEGI